MEVWRMSKAIELSDEQYRTIAQAAARRGQTPDALIATWIDELRRPASRFYETDDWFRHLGVSDATIEAVRREVREAAETDADTR
jgi:hypothetical protein